MNPNRKLKANKYKNSKTAIIITANKSELLSLIINDIYISGQKNKILVIVDNKELEKIIFIVSAPKTKRQFFLFLIFLSCVIRTIYQKIPVNH